MDSRGEGREQDGSNNPAPPTNRCSMLIQSLQSEADADSGSVKWKLRNISQWLMSQKLMSGIFKAGEYDLRLSLYESTDSGADYMSICVEKDAGEPARNCWYVFRLSVMDTHKDFYGRFDPGEISIKWKNCMLLSDFFSGYVVDDSTEIRLLFNVFEDSLSLTKPVADGYQSRFVWKIKGFLRLKKLLKKRQITGFCVKSPVFLVQDTNCRIVLYPRGQCKPPSHHLSLFLEVRKACVWGSFVRKRLSIVNQEASKSVAKESRNRHCMVEKEWGWEHFINLGTLLSKESGFVREAEDTLICEAQVLVLEEGIPHGLRNTWEVWNLPAFGHAVSPTFQTRHCDVRIRVKPSPDALEVFLESPNNQPDNHWLKYSFHVRNRMVSKESAITTKRWSNSGLRFTAEELGDFSGTLRFTFKIIRCSTWSEPSVLVTPSQTALSHAWIPHLYGLMKLCQVLYSSRKWAALEQKNIIGNRKLLALSIAVVGTRSDCASCSQRDDRQCFLISRNKPKSKDNEELVEKLFTLLNSDRVQDSQHELLVLICELNDANIRRIFASFQRAKHFSSFESFFEPGMSSFDIVSKAYWLTEHEITSYHLVVLANYYLSSEVLIEEVVKDGGQWKYDLLFNTNSEAVTLENPYNLFRTYYPDLELCCPELEKYSERWEVEDKLELFPYTHCEVLLRDSAFPVLDDFDVSKLPCFNCYLLLELQNSHGTHGGITFCRIPENYMNKEGTIARLIKNYENCLHHIVSGWSETQARTPVSEGFEVHLLLKSKSNEPPEN